ncbi:MAG: hypothetical protein ACTSUF_12715, partial [Candidatus Heimdallarchaeaceae archaeon]
FIQKEFHYVDELLLFILTKLGDGATSKWKSIKKIFDTSMILVTPPKITLKHWRTLVSNVRTLFDLYVYSNEELSKLLSLNIKDVHIYKTSISYENLALPPKIRPNIVFSLDEVTELNSKNIKYWIDILPSAQTPDDLSKILALKLSFVHSASLSAIEPLLKEEILVVQLPFVVKHLDQLNISKDTTLILQAWDKFFRSKGIPLSMMLNEEGNIDPAIKQITVEWLTTISTNYPSLHKKLLKLFSADTKILINDFVCYLNRTPLILSEFNNPTKQELIKLELLTLRDIVLRRPELCTNQKLLKQLQKLISKITLRSLREREHTLTPIPNEILTEKDLATLRKAGIGSVEEVEFYSECLEKLSTSARKIITKLMKLLKSSVFVLSDVVYSPKLFKYLLSRKIHSLFDLILAIPNDTFLQKELKDVIISSIANLDELKSRELERLSSFVDIEEYASILNKMNIQSIGELVYSALSSPIHSEIPEMMVFRAIFLLPLSYLAFTKKLITKFEKAGYILISDFLLLPEINEKLKIDLSESEIDALNQTKKTLTLSFLLDILNNQGYPIAKANFIDPKLRDSLITAGFTNVIHMLLPIGIISSYSSLRENQVKKIIENLNTPIYLITELVRANLEGVRKLWDKYIYTLLDLLTHDFASTAKIAHIPLRQWKSILNTLNIQSLVIGKKELIPLKETIPYLSKTDIVELSKAKISTLQHLIMPTKSDLRKKVYKLPNIQKLMKLVDSPIEQLDLEEKAISLLKNIGIKKISDFILYPAAFLEGPLELSYVKIKRIKQTIPKRKIVTPVRKTPAKRTPASKKTSTKSRKKTVSSSKKTSSTKTAQKASTKTRTSASTKTRKTSSTKRTTTSSKKSSSQTQKTQKPRFQSIRSKTSATKSTRKKKGD